MLKGSLSRWSTGEAQSEKGFDYPAIPDFSVEIPAGEVRKATLPSVPWNLGLRSYWWPNIPYREDYSATLHWLNLSLTEDHQVIHRRKERFGFVGHAEGPFFYTVNGVRYTSMGGSISHGQVGDYDCFYETPCFQPAGEQTRGCPETWRRYQRIGFNTLRLSTSVPSRNMLETADEAGYMLIVEGGNWFYQYSQYHPVNTPRQLQDNMLACRNHPCVARYSLANESIMKPADSPDLEWRWLIDSALEIDDTRPLVFEENPGQGGAGIIYGMKRGHARRMQHYDPIVQGGDRIRGMGELSWVTDGMGLLAIGAQQLRLKEWTHFAPWSWVNYWPNFLEGMCHDRHPWTQNNYPDRRDGVDGWGSPMVSAVQRALHPYLVVDVDLLERNPAIRETSKEGKVGWPYATPVYAAGSNIERKNDVFNGALAGTRMQLRWSARWDSPDGPEDSTGMIGPFEIQPGFHSARMLALRAPQPERHERVLYLVLESIKDGVVVYREDRIHFTVTGSAAG